MSDFFFSWKVFKNVKIVCIKVYLKKLATHDFKEYIIYFHKRMTIKE